MVIIGIMGATLDINVKTVKAGNVKKIGFLEITSTKFVHRCVRSKFSISFIF